MNANEVPCALARDAGASLGSAHRDMSELRTLLCGPLAVQAAELADLLNTALCRWQLLTSSVIEELRSQRTAEYLAVTV